MALTQEVKAELAVLPVTKHCCRRAEAKPKVGCFGKRRAQDMGDAGLGFLNRL